MLAVSRARGIRAAQTVGVYVTRTQVRHNSGLNSLWSWFKRKDAKKETSAPVIKTKDLVKNIEQQSKAGWEEAPVAAETKPVAKDAKDEPKSLASETAVDLEVIGLAEESLPLSAEKLAKIGLGQFQLKQSDVAKPEAALETLKAVSTAVVGGMEGALDTLEKRLELVKRFHKESGVRIPDLVISTVSTPQGVAAYLEKSLSSNFNYWEPNAIYLDAKDFEGSNVTVVDAQAARKQRQEAMDALVAEAELFVEQHDKESFKKALQ
ncbi:hypothetical protein CJU90_3785 [Yarrowia sp. C11]|nr:hypothetical protein CKK34_5395 [Yarrowia sp. E02]KAG5367487.1 hypothetical protein CJU90_3785 [Yarrowia sp. C11]